MDDILYHGDIYASLKQLKNESIAVAITSPPYWKQRDYGFEGQIGQENTSEEYIGKLVAVFNLLKDKLREDGIFYLNVGDKYLSRYGKSHLLQIPYRLAYHMIRNGWRLVDLIIWFKPNHMPSSVKDRFANTYEPVLVLAKNNSNIYKNKFGNVLKIPLQQTPWKHTAVFPEKLVEALLNRTSLEDGDIVLDPFAGTGTVAAVVNRMKTGLFAKKIYSVIIEKGDEFINIIKKRANITHIKEIKDVPYEWKPVKEDRIPDGEVKIIATEKYGEVYIAENSNDFLEAIRGLTTESFRSFHREDALYFFGVKKWSIEDLYYISRIFDIGYVLRNMIIVSDGSTWYPIFMFARDTRRVEYKFYLDRVRVKPKTSERRDWRRENFIGIRVRDITGKVSREGLIIKVIESYHDGFPKIVLVKWNGWISIEYVLHPEKDEYIVEGLKFRCPFCHNELIETYNPIDKNICPYCGKKLWVDIGSIPLIEEPKEVKEIIRKLEKVDYTMGEVMEIRSFEKKRATSSKFVELERINWGASPGARKLMYGEYFTKMRLYRIDQPSVARYLTILRKTRGLNITDVVKRLPHGYKHTVGHWFRTDFGGSIPRIEDIKLIKRIFKVDDRLLSALERTALKFQTVRASIKGKNPGDFIESMEEEQLKVYLKKLYLPPYEYIKTLSSY